MESPRLEADCKLMFFFVYKPLFLHADYFDNINNIKRNIAKIYIEKIAVISIEITHTCIINLTLSREN